MSPWVQVVPVQLTPASRPLEQTEPLGEQSASIDSVPDVHSTLTSQMVMLVGLGKPVAAVIEKEHQLTTCYTPDMAFVLELGSPSCLHVVRALLDLV
jgi:hypothetical protein